MTYTQSGHRAQRFGYRKFVALVKLSLIYDRDRLRDFIDGLWRAGGGDNHLLADAGDLQRNIERGATPALNAHMLRRGAREARSFGGDEILAGREPLETVSARAVCNGLDTFGRAFARVKRDGRPRHARALSIRDAPDDGRYRLRIS
ncbi:MAG TPA: hypothetical protein VF654_06120 [Pyrinomonadaceae bacterium]